MPTVDDLKKSSTLQQTDVKPDLTVTITGYEQKNMAKEGEPADIKWCLQFGNDVKPMTLNITNGDMIALNLGSRDFDQWIGKQVTLYSDPTIMCRGKMTGGIRVRYNDPQQQAPAQAPSQFTPDNNLAQQPPQPGNPPRTDDTGPLPEPPPF